MSSRQADFADVLEKLEAGRAQHVVGRRFAGEEGKDGCKNVALGKPAVDEMSVDLETGPEEAHGGYIANEQSVRQPAYFLVSVKQAQDEPWRRRLSRALSRQATRLFIEPERM